MDLLIRWPGNFGAAMLGTVLVRLLLPASAVGVAIAAQESSIGLFNLTGLPGLITICLTVALMDLTIYAQHRVHHSTINKETNSNYGFFYRGGITCLAAISPNPNLAMKI